ncbi:MAG: Response regulatory protein [Pseudomonadota bacterium]|nr:Response regulatory protein [Pseudomonadota bacterium]
MPVRNVLVVDDSKSARLMLRKMLLGFGLTVDTAESAEEALSHLHDQQPDAIFMDHTMPGMDGIAALRQIKKDPSTAAIPVAMYTSRDESTYREEARQAGAIDVLIKPAVPDILGVVLERMHQAVDAAPTLASASGPATIPAVAESVDMARIEKFVVDKTESVFYNAIESQVLPLINDVVSKLKQDIKTSQADACRQTALQVCEERLAEWRPPECEALLTDDIVRTQVSALLEERLPAFHCDVQEGLQKAQEGLQNMVQDVATQICQSQLHELSERLVRQLSTRFAEAVRKAAAAARDAAVDAAREAAVSAAQEAMAQQQFASRAMAEEERAAMAETPHWWLDAQRRLMRRVYIAAVVAAAAGVGAAVLVYSGLR